MEKITIIHYLNKRLKHSLINGIIEFPVYVRVSHGRKNERIKSDWIVHTCSEYDFENDKHILELKRYESEIITNIIQNTNNEKFNLSARLGHSKNTIVDIFLNYMFDKYEIKEPIISFISKKTNLSKSILNPYFRNDYLSANDWKELTERDIFNNKTRSKIIYLYLLMEFENKFYPILPDNVFGYRAGCLFITHEWKYRNKKAEFLSFAENKQILSENEIIDITKEFESNILENSTFDFRIE